MGSPHHSPPRSRERHVACFAQGGNGGMGGRQCSVSVGPVSYRALLSEGTRNMGYPVVLAMMYHDVLRASSEAPPRRGSRAG